MSIKEFVGRFVLSAAEQSPNKPLFRLWELYLRKAIAAEFGRPTEGQQ